MPPKVPRHLCNHAVMTKKLLSFTESEQKAARARDLSLPDGAQVDFCISCWTVNPHQPAPIKIQDFGIVKTHPCSKCRAKEIPVGQGQCNECRGIPNA